MIESSHMASSIQMNCLDFVLSSKLIYNRWEISKSYFWLESTQQWNCSYRDCFSEKKGVKTSEEEINYQHEYPPSDIYYSQTPHLGDLIEGDFNQEGLLRIGDIQMLQCQEPQINLSNGEILIHLHSLLDPNMYQHSQNLIWRSLLWIQSTTWVQSASVLYANLLCIGQHNVLTTMPHSLLAQSSK